MSGASDAELLAKVNALRKLIGQQPITTRFTTLTVGHRGAREHVELPKGVAATLVLHVGELVTKAG